MGVSGRFCRFGGIRGVLSAQVPDPGEARKRCRQAKEDAELGWSRHAV